MKFDLDLLLNSGPFLISLRWFAFGDGGVCLEGGGVFEIVELPRVVGGVEGERVVSGVHGGEIRLEWSVVMVTTLHCTPSGERMTGKRTGLAGLGASPAARKHSLF